MNFDTSRREGERDFPVPIPSSRARPPCASSTEYRLRLLIACEHSSYTSAEITVVEASIRSSFSRLCFLSTGATRLTSYRNGIVSSSGGKMRDQA